MYPKQLAFSLFLHELSSICPSERSLKAGARAHLAECRDCGESKLFASYSGAISFLSNHGTCDESGIRVKVDTPVNRGTLSRLFSQARAEAGV
jgi:hypothetical protein